MNKNQITPIDFEELFWDGSPWEKYCFYLDFKTCGELMLKATRSLKEFWGDDYCKGWISDKGYAQLSTARLDRWLSLTHLMNEWFKETIKEELNQAVQVIGWANLGALLECSIKLFLTVNKYSFLY